MISGLNQWATEAAVKFCCFSALTKIRSCTNVNVQAKMVGLTISDQVLHPDHATHFILFIHQFIV